MTLYAKPINDTEQQGLEQVQNRLRCERLENHIVKAWTSVSKISADDVWRQITDSRGRTLTSESCYVMEPTYMAPMGDYTVLFSPSEKSLDTCAEIMRKYADTQAEQISLSRDLTDDAVIERADIFDSRSRSFTQTIYDTPPEPKDFFASTEQYHTEVNGYIIRTRREIRAENLQLISVGVHGVGGEKLSLSITDKSGDYTKPERSNESDWAQSVVTLLSEVLSSLVAVVR